MSAPYHRSPFRAWLLAFPLVGLPFVVSRMAADLNKLSKRSVVDPRFFGTLIGLLLGFYFCLLLLLGLTFGPRDLLFDADARGLFAATYLVGIATVVAVAGSMATLHLRINQAFGEGVSLGGFGLVLTLTIFSFLSVAYLQRRLNRLADGGAQRAFLGASAC
jgi:hypothetical protein